MIKINMGCGKRNFGKDWVHIDGGDYEHLNYNDITNLSQFEDNSVDLIYASHIISYFDREEIKPILQEWKRILKLNGMLRLAVPDFQSMATLYTMRKYPLENFLGPLYGKMKMGKEIIYHKTVYDYNSLKELLLSVGFKDIDYWYWWETDHARFDDHSQAHLPHMKKETGDLISLNIQGKK